MGKRRRSDGGSGGGGSGWLPAAAAAASVVIAVVFALTSSSGSRQSQAEREWKAARSIMQREAKEVTLSTTVVDHLDRCLELDPSHGDCAFFRGRNLLQQGGPSNRRAVQLFAGIDTEQFAPAQRMETWYFMATAAEKAQETELQELGYRKIIQAAKAGKGNGSAPRGFRGVPNAWAGVASIRISAGDHDAALEAVAKGIKAATKLRPQFGNDPNDEVAQRHMLSFGSALPELYSVKGMAEARVGGAVAGVDAAQRVYESVVVDHFNRWPRPDVGKAAQLFGLNLASLRLAAQPALMTAEPAVDPAADTGGWGESITERPADANCEIDVVECVEDKEAFLQRYVDGNRPVLLRGFLHGEARCTGGSVVGGDGNEMWPWPALQSWRRDKLLADHGGLSVPIRISSQTANEYDKALGSGFLANTTTLSAYLEEMQRHAEAAENDTDPLYLFEPVVLPETRGQEYPTLLPLFDDPQRFASWDLRESANQVFLGATNTGLSWHQHSQAYNVAMYGARHWFLAAPHNTMNQVQSTFDWLREWQAPPPEERDERVMRCEQRAGDLIYVPQQWWHATLNVQESVGFAQQLGGRRGLFEHQVRWFTAVQALRVADPLLLMWSADATAAAVTEFAVVCGRC